jgi:aryl-alcohol dehydrogenase-like predicted oxidoreductase
MGRVRRGAAIAAIRQARELAVNLFDTAQGYGFAASEQLLGRALRDDLDKRRNGVVIATKGGLRMTDEGLVRDASPDCLRGGLEASLRSLGIDCVDIYEMGRLGTETSIFTDTNMS